MAHNILLVLKRALAGRSTRRVLRNRCRVHGPLADWLGMWLQPTVDRFDSGRDLRAKAWYNGVMLKYWYRLTASRRGETYNFLIYPFLIATLSYGMGFVFFTNTADVGRSSLFTAMHSIFALAPQMWGIIAIVTIIVGLTFLLFDIPPAGEVSGLLGFMVWVFASFCWILTGAVLVFFAVGLPNLMFWFWQYFSLARFRKENIEDEI